MTFYSQSITIYILNGILKISKFLLLLLLLIHAFMHFGEGGGGGI